MPLRWSVPRAVEMHADDVQSWECYLCYALLQGRACSLCHAGKVYLMHLNATLLMSLPWWLLKALCNPVPVEPSHWGSIVICVSATVSSDVLPASCCLLVDCTACVNMLCCPRVPVALAEQQCFVRLASMFVNVATSAVAESIM